MLERKGFSARWRKWIDGSLSSVTFSFILNGKPRSCFGGTQGLHQGDPLTPFLFILVANVSSQMITKVERNVIRGWHVSSKDVVVSHL